jgi:hypothetical protein
MKMGIKSTRVNKIKMNNAPVLTDWGIHVITEINSTRIEELSIQTIEGKPKRY